MARGFRHIKAAAAFIILLIASQAIHAREMGDSVPTVNEEAVVEIETPAEKTVPAPPLHPTSTPVDIDREKPEQPSLHYFDRHGNPLETPVRFLTELDTAVNVRPGPVWPTFNGVSVGVNFFDGVMMLAGQERGSFDVAVDCSIHNWFFPVVEAGIGFSDAHPDDGRCHFKVAPSFFARAGINYNFLYKSNPDYQVYVGLRGGVSDFGYDIYSISPGSQYYWGEGNPKQKTGLHATSFYGQVLAGLKVKIWRGFSMGWSFRYAFNISNRWSDPDYPAWFIPGKGTGSISATFSAVWTFGRKNREKLLKPE